MLHESFGVILRSGVHEVKGGSEAFVF